jgi:hypothetical protein
MLRNSTSNESNLQAYVDRWANIWLASRLAGEKTEQLRKMHALIEGLDKPLDGRNISRSLEKIKIRLGEFPPACSTPIKGSGV